VTVGARFRLGRVHWRGPAADFEKHQDESSQMCEILVSQDSEILDQLVRLFPQADQISFRDLKTGESWRTER
jgi:hypothetical protein